MFGISTIQELKNRGRNRGRLATKPPKRNGEMPLRCRSGVVLCPKKPSRLTFLRRKLRRFPQVDVPSWTNRGNYEVLPGRRVCRGRRSRSYETENAVLRVERRVACPHPAVLTAYVLPNSQMRQRSPTSPAVPSPAAKRSCSACGSNSPRHHLASLLPASAHGP